MTTLTGKSFVVVFSGGLDSTTLLYDIIEQGGLVKQAVSFNYGQRHKKELEYARATAKQFGLKHTIIDLWSSGLTEALSVSKSSLVSDEEVPEGHYAANNMKSTVVPNRNMIMLSIAGGIAVAEGANKVATGVHSGDHFIYPDCRPEFIEMARRTLFVGNEGFGDLNIDSIYAPYIFKTKDDIALRALDLDVPLAETWSCYNGRENHCGRCGTCVERLEAINNAISSYHKNTGVWKEDHTVYEDEMFWTRAKENA